MGAWGNYKNGEIPLSALKNVEGQYFEPATGNAIVAALAEVRAQGIKISINEGYRPLGIPADANIKSDRNGNPVKKTSTGGSNQWFQYGRAKRGETPQAAYPGGSIHGWGMAADVSPGSQNGLVKSIFANHGLIFDISSEVWHCSLHAGASAPAAGQPKVTVAQWKKIQGILKAHYGYTGAIDGNPGELTWTATQKWLKAGYGYAGAIDGKPGPLTYSALSRALTHI
jgi:hypothetical protein